MTLPLIIERIKDLIIIVALTLTPFKVGVGGETPNSDIWVYHPNWDQTGGWLGWLNVSQTAGVSSEPAALLENDTIIHVAWIEQAAEGGKGCLWYGWVQARPDGGAALWGTLVDPHSPYNLHSPRLEKRGSLLWLCATINAPASALDGNEACYMMNTDFEWHPVRGSTYLPLVVK